MGSPKGPSKKEKAEAEAVRIEQKTQLAELDDEENRRIKKMLSGGRGTRGYRGGPMFRARPSNTAGGRVVASAASGANASAAASALRSGGARGGLRRTGPSLVTK